MAKPKGGARPGAGRPALPRPDRITGIAHASRILDALNAKPAKDESIEIEGWRELYEAKDLRIRLDTRKYLYDKRDGKAVQPIEGMNDRPLSVTVVNHIERPARK